MIVSASILTEKEEIFFASFLPNELRSDIKQHAKDFMHAIKREKDDEIELPYIENSNLRYIYKQSGDLYWLVVTKTESDMFNDIELLGKLVFTILEYGSSETNSGTLTDEQRDLYYRHIWRPWDDDSQCPLCSCHCNSPGLWERELENRLQFLMDIRHGHVAEQDANYFNGLVAESWHVSVKLTPKWKSGKAQGSPSSESDSLCSSEDNDQSISEEAVIYGCRMKCRLEDIRIELLRIQDPYLRLFARRDLLSGSMFDPRNDQISSAPSLRDLDTSGLPAQI